MATWSEPRGEDTPVQRLARLIAPVAGGFVTASAVIAFLNWALVR